MFVYVPVTTPFFKGNATAYILNCLWTRCVLDGCGDGRRYVYDVGVDRSGENRYAGVGQHWNC